MRRARGILFCSMLLSALLFACQAFAAVGGGVTESDFDYTVNNGKATITGWKGESRNYPIALTIPRELGGYEVEAIGEEALSYVNGWTGLSELTLPDTIKTLEYMAFYSTRCEGPVYIPASVTSIGTYAFSYMDGVTEFRVEGGNPNYFSIDGVLYGNGGKTLLHYPLGKSGDVFAVPDDVTLLYCTSLANSAVKTLLAPSQKIDVMGYTFYGCTMDIYGRPGTYLEEAIENGWTLGALTFHDIAGYGGPYSLKLDARYRESCFIQDIPAKTVRLTATLAPGQYSGAPLTWSSSNASVASVDGTGLVTILGPGEASIIARASGGLAAQCDFYAYEISFAVKAPAGLTSIGRDAFNGDASLTSVLVRSEGDVIIGDGAFSGCSNLEHVYIGPNIASISDGAFTGCPDVIIVCEEGSPARQYAINKGLAVIVR